MTATIINFSAERKARTRPLRHGREEHAHRPLNTLLITGAISSFALYFAAVSLLVHLCAPKELMGYWPIRSTDTTIRTDR